MCVHSDAGESFFENLPEVEAPSQQPSRTASVLSPRPATAGEDHGEAGESEAEIQRALFVSNYAAALDICLQVLLPLQHSTLGSAAPSSRLFNAVT